MPVAAENLYASTTGCIAYRSDVQSSGVDYLHMLIASIEYPVERYHIQAQYFISVHDELRYLVKEDKDRAALQIFTFVDESDVCVCARYGQFAVGCFRRDCMVHRVNGKKGNGKQAKRQCLWAIVEFQRNKLLDGLVSSLT